MDNQIEKFDPSTLMQGVKDRIKSTFVSLIPDGQWDTMVQKEIDEFFKLRKTIISKKTAQSVTYGNKIQDTFVNVEQESSPFRDLVWDYCAEMTLIILKEKINKEYFTQHWVHSQMELKDNMKQLIKEAAPLAAATFFERIAFGLVNDLQQKIQNNF